MPRNTDDFLTEAYSSEYPSGIDYVSGAGPTSSGGQEGAFASLSKPVTEYNYNVNPDSYGAGSQLPLFWGSHTGPELSVAMSTPHATTSHAIPLLAHIVKESERRWGVRPTASRDTSRHSEPLANKAIASGVIPGYTHYTPGVPRKTPDNGLSWMNAKHHMNGIKMTIQNNPESWTQIPRDTIRGDRDSVVKEMLTQKAQTRPRSQQFEQLHLPL